MADKRLTCSKCERTGIGKPYGTMGTVDGVLVDYLDCWCPQCWDEAWKVEAKKNGGFRMLPAWRPPVETQKEEGVS